MRPGSQIRVSAASTWQKKNCWLSNSSGLFEYSSRRFPTPVTPGYRHHATHERVPILSTKVISMNTPGSSNILKSGEVTTYPAGRP